MTGEKKQNWFAKHKILTALIVVVVIAIAAAGAGGSDKKSTNSNTSSNSQSSNSETVKPEAKKDDIPAEYKSALAKAKSYSETMNMSKQGIYDQLTSDYGEKFTPAAAQYAVDNLKADYNANALAKAKSYQKTMNMSPAAIRDQLTSANGEKFTQTEADYAVQNLNN